MESRGEQPRRGDAPLAALLRWNSEVISGGMYFAIGASLSWDEVPAGIDGYRYFGLTNAADLIERATSTDDHGLDALDQEYAVAVSTDDALPNAFEVRYTDYPEDFANFRVR